MTTIDREESVHTDTFQGWPRYVIKRVTLPPRDEIHFEVLRLDGSAYVLALHTRSWRDAVDATFAMNAEVTA